MEKLFISLYLDEDVSVKATAFLRHRGFNVVCTSEVGNMGKSDREQLEYSVSQGRALLTHNKRHFVALHEEYNQRGGKHFGIIVAGRRRSNEDFVRRILRLLDQVTADEMVSQLRYL